MPTPDDNAGSTDTEKPKGRRTIPGEAPPASSGPEDSGQLSADEGEVGVEAGVYFSKAPKHSVWHAYSREHDPVGRVYQGTEGEWHAKVDGRDAPMTFGSAPAGRAFIYGYFFAREGDAK